MSGFGEKVFEVTLSENIPLEENNSSQYRLLQIFINIINSSAIAYVLQSSPLADEPSAKEHEGIKCVISHSGAEFCEKKASEGEQSEHAFCLHTCCLDCLKTAV